ncbi:hypothetical protein [Micromonospora sp. NPDC048898]|uniref:hypothetical protein n=1 Tax=Micromonospora sp. NPDC048898 TaxID=3364260 RepID=UPI003716BB26
MKNKHLSSFDGNYAKYDTADISQAQSWVAEALKSDRAVFLPNKEGSYKIEVDLGRRVGTRGQEGIRILINDAGKVFNNFPFNPAR